MATLSREAMQTLPPPKRPMISAAEARIAYYGADAKTLLDTLDKRIRDNSAEGFSSCMLTEDDVKGVDRYAKGGDHPVLKEVEETLVRLGYRVTKEPTGGTWGRTSDNPTPARFNVSWA